MSDRPTRDWMKSRELTFDDKPTRGAGALGGAHDQLARLYLLLFQSRHLRQDRPQARTAVIADGKQRPSPTNRRVFRRLLATAVPLLGVLLLSAVPVATASARSTVGGYSVTSVPVASGAVAGLAADPSTHNVFVADSLGNAVSVVDESNDPHRGTVTASIPVGTFPVGIAVDPSTHNVFVANELSNSVSVIHEDRHGARVTATIPVAVGPFGVAVDPRSHHVYISTDGNSEVSVLREDCCGGTLSANIPIGEGPSALLGLAVDPNTRNVYVVNEGATGIPGSVVVVHEHGDTGKVSGTIPLGLATNPFAAAIDPSLHNVYVTEEGNNALAVINEITNAATTIPVSDPAGVAVDPSTHRVYVANQAGNTVSVIDESRGSQTGTVIASISVGVNPIAVTVDPANHAIYVTNNGSDTMSVIEPTR